MLSKLQDQIVWKHFQAICAIPHPSGHTEEIKQYLITFGKNLNLETKTDDAGNVLIKKPAFKGLEEAKAIILQAHMDMVPQKNSDTVHNFYTDPLKLIIEGDWLKATNTTLGADNGIGLAAILAVLESKTIKHGQIAALFTMDEETGMVGAFGLNKEFVQGDVLMNLDSEDEGELFVGCAGGIDANFTFNYNLEAVPEDDIALKIGLTGLHGGHSGVDIHLERANSNKLLFRFLKIAISEYKVRLASVNGGSLRNAIPRESFCVITIPSEGLIDLTELAQEIEATFNKEYDGIEDKIKLSIEKTDNPAGVFPKGVQDDLVNAICAAPNGAMGHFSKMPSVVETSTNLAIIKTDENKITVQSLLRSAIESKIEELCSMHESVFSLAGAKVEFEGGYPSWEPKFESPILQKMMTLYEEKWRTTPEIKVIHAGLECGIIGALNPDLDMISFGPTIRYPHSPNEKVLIPSVTKFWEFLKASIVMISTEKLK